MKYLQKLEMRFTVIILSICLLLVLFFYFTEIINSISVLSQKEKISMLYYKETSETHDKIKGIRITNSYVSYLYPNKLRIETIGETKKVEIYNGKRYIYYDEVSRQAKTGITLSKRIPKALEEGIKLDKIFKTNQYEFFGYEEKENKKLMVIGVTLETDGHIILDKYWIEKIYNTNLPYKEEQFIDNCVVSKTTYTYLKVNEVIDKNIFKISPQKYMP